MTLDAWRVAAWIWLTAAVVAILPWTGTIDTGEIVLAVAGLLLAVLCLVRSRSSSDRGG